MLYKMSDWACDYNTAAQISACIRNDRAHHHTLLVNLVKELGITDDRQHKHNS